MSNLKKQDILGEKEWKFQPTSSLKFQKANNPLTHDWTSPHPLQQRSETLNLCNNLALVSIIRGSLSFQILEHFILWPFQYFLLKTNSTEDVKGSEVVLVNWWRQIGRFALKSDNFKVNFKVKIILFLFIVSMATKYEERQQNYLRV